MATYYPTNDQTGPFQANIGNITSQACVWEIGSATLGTADTLVGPTVPANSMVIGCTLSATDIDTSNTLTLDVGDATDDNRLMNAVSVGTAGGISSTMVAANMGYTYTTATRIDVTPQAASAGGVANGRVALRIDYIVVEPTT